MKRLGGWRYENAFARSQVRGTLRDSSAKNTKQTHFEENRFFKLLWLFLPIYASISLLEK